MEFRNDITPLDYMFMTGEEIWYLIAYSVEKPSRPFVVEVIDSDALGWYRGTLYDVNGKGEYLSEWPKTWKWAAWKEKENE